jgi:hypothetical protein
MTSILFRTTAAGMVGVIFCTVCFETHLRGKCPEAPVACAQPIEFAKPHDGPEGRGSPARDGLTFTDAGLSTSIAATSGQEFQVAMKGGAWVATQSS